MDEIAAGRLIENCSFGLVDATRKSGCASPLGCGLGADPEIDGIFTIPQPRSQ
jgi:hypothetical protein